MADVVGWADDDERLLEGGLIAMERLLKRGMSMRKAIAADAGPVDPSAAGLGYAPGSMPAPAALPPHQGMGYAPGSAPASPARPAAQGMGYSPKRKGA